MYKSWKYIYRNIATKVHVQWYWMMWMFALNMHEASLYNCTKHLSFSVFSFSWQSSFFYFNLIFYSNSVVAYTSFSHFPWAISVCDCFYLNIDSLVVIINQIWLLMRVLNLFINLRRVNIFIKNIGYVYPLRLFVSRF